MLQDGDLVLADSNAADAARTAATLLNFMEAYLTTRVFLAADHPTIADLARCSYVAAVPEGGISLEQFPSIRTPPGFRPMPPWPTQRPN